jgi:hypothetical protein
MLLSLSHLLIPFLRTSPPPHPTKRTPTSHLTRHLFPTLEAILAILYLTAFLAMASIFYRNYTPDDEAFATSLLGNLDFGDMKVLDESGFPDRWVRMMDVLWVDLVGCVLFALGGAVGVGRGLGRMPVRSERQREAEWKGHEWCA